MGVYNHFNNNVDILLNTVTKKTEKFTYLSVMFKKSNTQIIKALQGVDYESFITDSTALKILLKRRRDFC